jgi:homoserine O-acetyltransferase
MALPDPFVMRRGGVLRGARIAYETWGRLSSARDNAILLFTGLSPSAHAASSRADPSQGWWQGMVGPGLALDTQCFFVVCVNSLGSCFGSTGPSSVDPANGTPYRLSFPELSIEDIAAGGFHVVRSLGIEQLHTVIGASLGGMTAPAFAACFPGMARRVISISGTAAASPFSIALRSIQREAILSDPEWKGGDYDAHEPPRSGMRLARKLGTLTYRSAAEWRQRFGRQGAGGRAGQRAAFASEFAVESYLEAHAQRFVRAFDANCYLYLSRAMDRFDLAAHGGSQLTALGRAGLESALVIGVESDMLFAIDEQRSLAAELQRSGAATRFVALSCIQGHDSFLIDLPRFSEPIRAFLSRS